MNELPVSRKLCLSTSKRAPGLAYALVAICLLGFFLRLLQISAQSLWWDEAVSLHLATSTVTDLIADRAAHVHPPLYFLLLKGWVAGAGTSAFSVRLFSAWFNTLLVAAVYGFGRRFLDRRVGLVAALLTALSSLYIVYSQEARVYALLPLVYLALLTLVGRLETASEVRQAVDANRPARETGQASPPERCQQRRKSGGLGTPWRDWLLLAAVEVVGLYLHYVFLFAAAYANLVILFRLWRARRALGRWLVSSMLVVLVCLPWLVTVWMHREAVQADAGVDSPFVEPLPLDYFIRLLWTFQWTGLVAASGYPPLQVAALVLAGLLLTGVTLLSTRARGRTVALRLLAHWLAPLSPAILMWQVKPLSHPRYVALFSVALFLLAAHVITEVSRGRIVGKAVAAALGLSLGVTSLIALQAWYVDPRFGKDNVQGLAAWLERNATRDALIVAPWQDWSLDYAYSGPAPIIRPNPADEDAVWSQLGASTATARHVFLVSYYRGSQDRRGLVPFALEAAGHLTDRYSFKGLHAQVYTLGKPVGPVPAGAPADARFGPLRLIGVWLEQDAPADTAVAVATRWQVDTPVRDRYRVSLRLRDVDGWDWATADAWMLDLHGFPTDSWVAGTAVDIYHILPLEPGTPPLTYTLSVETYTSDDEGNLRSVDLLDAAGNPQGRSYVAGTVLLAPGRGLGTAAYSAATDLSILPEPIDFGGGLLLEAVQLDRTTAAPGHSVYVTLRWRASAPSLPDLRPILTLSQANNVLVTVEDAPAGGRYPTNHWRAGEVVLEHRRLTIPPSAADGPGAIAVELDNRRVTVGSVQIAVWERLYAVPPMAHLVNARFGDVAELLGYDLAPGPYSFDRPISLTLYWRALSGAANADHTVFSHVLASDGHLVAQHDGPPAVGARPTLGWMPGEVIADLHTVAFREPYTGPATIEVGLYDRTTLERVLAGSGADFVTLPSSLNVGQP